MAIRAGPQKGRAGAPLGKPRTPARRAMTLPSVALQGDSRQGAASRNAARSSAGSTPACRRAARELRVLQCRYQDSVGFSGSFRCWASAVIPALRAGPHSWATSPAFFGLGRRGRRMQGAAARTSDRHAQPAVWSPRSRITMGASGYRPIPPRPRSRPASFLGTQNRCETGLEEVPPLARRLTRILRHHGPVVSNRTLRGAQRQPLARHPHLVAASRVLAHYFQVAAA